MSMVVLCGGSGFGHLYKQFSFIDPDLICLVNGFDDGLTSGEIRSRLGILAPSDFGKLYGALLPLYLREWWEDRRFVMGANGSTDEVVKAGQDNGLEASTAAKIAQLIEPLEQHCAARPIRDVPPRNFVTAAALLRHRSGANRALRDLADLLHLPSALVSVTDSDARVYGQTSSGREIAHEFELNTTTEPVARLWVTAKDGTARISEDASNALSEATSVLLGPGSSYSSIVATLVLAAPLIAARPIPKIWIHPLVPESPGAPGTARDAVASISALTGRHLVTDAVVDAKATKQARRTDPWNYAEHQAPVAGSDGRHDPQRLLSVIMEILESHRRIDGGLPSSSTPAPRWRP